VAATTMLTQLTSVSYSLVSMLYNTTPSFQHVRIYSSYEGI